MKWPVTTALGSIHRLFHTEHISIDLPKKLSNLYSVTIAESENWHNKAFKQNIILYSAQGRPNKDIGRRILLSVCKRLKLISTFHLCSQRKYRLTQGWCVITLRGFGRLLFLYFFCIYILHNVSKIVAYIYTNSNRN